MANWRRAREGAAIHVVADNAPSALCGVDRAHLAGAIYDTGEAAPDLCAQCAQRLLDAADNAVRLADAMVEGRGHVAADGNERFTSEARDALRELIRIVPGGPTTDLLLYARASLWRNDPQGARDSIRTWRANMRTIGVLPA